MTDESDLSSTDDDELVLVDGWTWIKPPPSYEDELGAEDQPIPEALHEHLIQKQQPQMKVIQTQTNVKFNKIINQFQNHPWPYSDNQQNSFNRFYYQAENLTRIYDDEKVDKATIEAETIDRDSKFGNSNDVCNQLQPQYSKYKYFWKNKAWPLINQQYACELNFSSIKRVPTNNPFLLVFIQNFYDHNNSKLQIVNTKFAYTELANKGLQKNGSTSENKSNESTDNNHFNNKTELNNETKHKQKADIISSPKPKKQEKANCLLGAKNVQEYGCCQRESFQIPTQMYQIGNAYKSTPTQALFVDSYPIRDCPKHSELWFFFVKHNNDDANIIKYKVRRCSSNGMLTDIEFDGEYNHDPFEAPKGYPFWLQSWWHLEKDYLFVIVRKEEVVDTDNQFTQCHIYRVNFMSPVFIPVFYGKFSIDWYRGSTNAVLPFYAGAANGMMIFHAILIPKEFERKIGTPDSVYFGEFCFVNNASQNVLMLENVRAIDNYFVPKGSRSVGNANFLYIIDNMQAMYIIPYGGHHHSDGAIFHVNRSRTVVSLMANINNARFPCGISNYGIIAHTNPVTRTIKWCSLIQDRSSDILNVNAPQLRLVEGMTIRWHRTCECLIMKYMDNASNQLKQTAATKEEYKHAQALEMIGGNTYIAKIIELYWTPV